MKKSLVVFFVLILVAFSALAQDNKLAFFAIDSDLTTTGFQGGSVVKGIGGGKRVGFAVYVKNVDQLRTISVDFTWDSTKAAYSGDSGASIDLDERNVNGADITLSEENALGSPSGVGEVNEAGNYAITVAKLGGDAVVSTDYVLAYLLVLKTDAAFTTSDSFGITAKISVLNDGGVEKKLGERSFYVNGVVAVEPSTWGKIKNLFKD